MYDLRDPADLEELWDLYGGARPKLLAAVLSQADRAGAKSALVEFRYIDPDYRSEHSHFYSTTFRRYPSVAHRVHFFEKPLGDRATDARLQSAFETYGYVGYTVVRPVDASPIGRTMLRPPNFAAGRLSCTTADHVNLFGSRVEVDAAPFMAQDSQLSVCVHVTAWTCAYYHHLRFGAQRLLPSDIAGYTPMERGRLVPSGAVTVTQLVQLLARAGLPPVTYSSERLPPGESMTSIACRYLDSGMPVIAAGGGHTFVLLGYRWVREEGRLRVQFVRHDDLAGPYELVDTVTHDQYHPWEYLVTPLPGKVYMSGEGAERLGAAKLVEALSDSEHAQSGDLRSRLSEKAPSLSFRTSVHLSNEFKSAMAGRAAEIAAGYQWLQLSRWVWVVELVDVGCWRRNEPSVLAEAVVDATGHADDERVLAWRIPGLIGWIVPDYARPDSMHLPEVGLLPSVVRADTSVVDL